MPDSIRRAEIDTRDGHILRELEPKEAELLQAQQSVMKKNANTSKPDPTGTPAIID